MLDNTYDEQDFRPATQPVSFSRRYANLEMRLLANSVYDVVTGCWLWMGKRSKRRGGREDGRITFRVDGRHVSRRAHRVSYEEFNGPIPDGYEVDHGCRNTLCINPGHLEAVTPEVNRNRRDAHG